MPGICATLNYLRMFYLASAYMHYRKSKFEQSFLLSRFMFVFGPTAPGGPWPPHSEGFQITHKDAVQSVGLLWRSDQLVVETST